MEGGIIVALTPMTIGYAGGFVHVYRVTFIDDEEQRACVYLQRWAEGQGPAIGDELTWQEGDTYIADWITTDYGRIRKFGMAFEEPKD